MAEAAWEADWVERARLSARLLAAPLEARLPFRSPAAIERIQRRRLAATVRHAHQHVPYYRETMRRLGLGPGDLRTVTDLARLPIVERAQVQRDPEYFVSRAQALERLVRVRSGGTTGEPLSFYRDLPAVFAARARRERARSLMAAQAGRRLHFRMATILMSGGAGSDAASRFERVTLLTGRLRVTTLRLSVLDPVVETVTALNEFRPDVIATFGSYLEVLCAHLERSGQEFVAPRVITYAADALSPAVRRLIAERYAIEVISVYQAIETPMIAFECQRHRGLHVNVDVCPLRIVDADGVELADGESGNVVVSNLVNRGTVLLNYRLGDLARRLAEPCDCGRHLPLMSLPEGRTDEWVTTASGRLIHPVAIRIALRHDDDVLRYQVVQDQADRFRVTLVTRPGADRDQVSRGVGDALARLLGPDTQVQIGFADSLPRTPRGKVRPVITNRSGQPAL
jgi:phenylacetate-CoA ligase